MATAKKKPVAGEIVYSVSRYASRWLDYPWGAAGAVVADRVRHD